MKKLEMRMPTQKELPFLLLMIVGVMEFLFIIMESLFSYIGYYLVEDYIIVPCLLFVGIVLTKKLTPFAKKRMLLAAVAIAWFVVVQIIHKLSGMGTHPIGTVFFVYLMAFPFASAMEDAKSKGMDLIGGIFLAASLVLVFDTLLLILNLVPGFMEPYVFWDGARLHVFWHPNISACLFMVGIGFAVIFWFRAKKKSTKLLMILAIAAQFIAMTLTNCRTTLLMTGAFFGSMAFFMIYKGGWKRFIVGLLVALAVLVIAFKFSGVVFELHNNRLEAKIIQQLQLVEQTQQEQLEQSAKPKQETEAIPKVDMKYSVDKESGEITIISDNGQGTLSNDLRTLNGRTGIWKGAFHAVRDNKKLALWGTEYVDVIVSQYNHFPVDHTHNSWMEALLRLGLPGLLLALTFTCIAVRSAWFLIWSQQAEIWKKVMAVLSMCVMVAGFLEPYLFITNVYYHITDFIFFFCTGYLDYWRHQLKNAG